MREITNEMMEEEELAKQTLQEDASEGYVERIFAKQRKKIKLWRMVALVCLLGLVGVSAVMAMKLSKEEKKNTTMEEQTKTERKVEKLSEQVNAWNDGTKLLKAEVRQFMGFEYLCFSGQTEEGSEFCLYYRNEYEKSSEKNENQIMMEAFFTFENHVTELSQSADITKEWEAFLPTKRTFGEQDYLVFLKYNDSTSVEPIMEMGISSDTFVASTMPDTIQLMNLSNGVLSAEFAPEEVLQNQFGFDFAVSGESVATAVLSYNDYNYAFTGSEEVLKAAATSGNRALTMREHLALQYTEDGLAFATLVGGKTGEYYGEFTGELIISENPSVKDARFGVYVPCNYEDPDGDRIITPRTEYLAEKVTLNHTYGRYLLPRYEVVERVKYDWEKLHSDGKYWYMTDDAGECVSEIGIDVSKHQGEIDWEQVAASGIQFVYVRMGYRGCNEGTLELDEYALANLEGAKANGLKVGVYFYSQAITVQEGIEEAQFVLENLNGMELDYEIVWDTEYYNREGARGNTTSRELRTQIGKAFCETIANAGYTPMVYSNTYWSILHIDRDQLAEYPFWFAYYGDKISYSFDFDVLQYSESGSVPGVTGDCDMDIRLNWIK